MRHWRAKRPYPKGLHDQIVALQWVRLGMQQESKTLNIRYSHRSGYQFQIQRRPNASLVVIQGVSLVVIQGVRWVLFQTCVDYCAGQALIQVKGHECRTASIWTIMLAVFVGIQTTRHQIGSFPEGLTIQGLGPSRFQDNHNGSNL